MTVPVGGDIGEEVRPLFGSLGTALTMGIYQVHTVDQHLIFTSGLAKAIVAGEERDVKAGDMVIVPQGTKHNCKAL